MAASETPTRRHLNITAISAKNGVSTIECWVLDAPPVIASEAGIAGAAFTQLGKAGNLSYAVIPPRFDDGFHNAPVAQYVAFTSGEAIISVPGSDEKAFIKGGKYGLIFAADTASVSKKGHATQYPSDQETTAFQIPTADGEIPPHTVLHPGPCRQLRFEPQ
ncbi:MAG: hypothetical protein LQ350_003320 [Teloschistes chrysophthalmus]|nr:MAG: hypothetical protein LQ350_003320 [Niorma chrysophthalma]